MSAGQIRIDKGIDRVAVVAIVLVVLAVIVGFFRLALDHLGYLVPTVSAAAAGYYIYWRSE